jgi:murein DD-endopeptidase MepM/ murein hydrolase activator NlpD
MSKFRSPFQSGYTRFTSGYRTSSRPTHNGVDYSAPKGTPLVAVADGVVTKVKTNGIDYQKTRLADLNRNVAISQANYIYLKVGEYTFLYLHLDKVHARANQQVKEGDVIGTNGSTGYSTGPHLHFEAKKNGTHTNPHNVVDFNKFTNLQNSEMIQLPITLKIKTTNTVPMNFRTEPTTSSRVHGYKVEGNLEFLTSHVASGTAVNNVSTWYKIEYKGNAGWINGAYVAIVEDKKEDCTSFINQLNNEKKTSTDLRTKNEQLTKEIEDLKNSNSADSTLLDNISKMMHDAIEYITSIFNRKK